MRTSELSSLHIDGELSVLSQFSFFRRGTHKYYNKNEGRKLKNPENLHILLFCLCACVCSVGECTHNSPLVEVWGQIGEIDSPLHHVDFSHCIDLLLGGQSVHPLSYLAEPLRTQSEPLSRALGRKFSSTSIGFPTSLASLPKSPGDAQESNYDPLNSLPGRCHVGQYESNVISHTYSFSTRSESRMLTGKVASHHCATPKGSHGVELNGWSRGPPVLVSYSLGLGTFWLDDRFKARMTSPMSFSPWVLSQRLQVLVWREDSAFETLTQQGRGPMLVLILFLLYLSLLSPPCKSVPPASSGSHLGGVTSLFVGSDGRDGKTGQEHPLSLCNHTQPRPLPQLTSRLKAWRDIRGKEACKQLLKTPRCYPLPRWTWSHGFHHTAVLLRIQSKTLWGQEGLWTHLLELMFL